MSKEASDKFRKLIHDMNNDLGVALAGVQVVGLQVKDEEILKSVAKAENATRNLRDKVKELRASLIAEGVIIEESK